MSLVSIKTAIQNKLESVAHVDSVYGYETGKETGHSYITVTKSRFESSFADTGRNIQDWFFSVKLFTERSKDGFGVVLGESVSDGIVDDIVKAFHMDTTLSGSCKFVEPIDGDFGYVEGPESVRIAEITLKAEEVIDINTGATA